MNVALPGKAPHVTPLVKAAEILSPEEEQRRFHGFTQRDRRADALYSFGHLHDGQFGAPARR